jgi:serine/threonine-protein kinase
VLWLLARNLVNNDNQTQTVPVPNVVGERLNAARTDLEAAGLKVPDDKVIRAPAPADQPDAAPGTVIAQDPAANTEVDTGSEVTLTVVEEPGAVTIPTGLAGQTPEAVAAALQALNADLVITTQPEASTDVADGLVTRTDPAEGTEVQPGSSVTIFISTGPATVNVPDVTCQSFGSAKHDLTAAGLVPFTSPETRPVNPLCPNGTKVAAQDPSPGTPVPAGTTVTLFPSEAAPPTGPTGLTNPTGGTGPTA